ncbi:MAG TPA: formylglycine-generating enzyme family protein, partial [Spirochaetia bacterium]|nr:formylglycine-generating enzyme family protein [Spirochaetia bacterium]
GDRFEWQVRAQNDAGTWFSWSSSQRFETGSFALAFLPVIAEGDDASFIRGFAGGSRDEQPVSTITLTRAYEAAVTPITNEDLVRIVEYANARGLVTVDSEAIWSTGPEPQALVGLGRMDYGEQFGLRFAEGSVTVVPGYERHPAIGISWNGAVAVADLLSYVEGYGTGDEDAGAYRLPTEAEWEYLARGQGDRIFPWGGTLSGRVSNYYRSFDPFEDVNEPFTGAGGPTNPVGYFDGSSRDGFQTTNDASPFGMRDLVGNVWEWTSDRYDPRYYETSDDTDPRGPDATDFGRPNEAVVLAVALDPNQRVVRGSAWNTRAPDVRLTNRGRYTEGGLSYSIGLRLVRSPRP